ncbi:iron transporter FeoB [Achromatium sp. WMS2]|nr:iron transporter FeoB [Achromatium sp. WMS2]
MTKHDLTIALVGNPNCGKTTLFNALTGARQTVGNWPGVTVERKSGYYSHNQKSIHVVDLPGVYAMDSIADATPLDQKVTHDYILSNAADLIVNIVDAANLERNLYLTTQLLELGIPIILVLNMLDIAAQKGIFLEYKKLSNLLGCPVVLTNANTNNGLQELKNVITNIFEPKPLLQVQYPEVITQAVTELSKIVGSMGNLPKTWLALKLLEGDDATIEYSDPQSKNLAIVLRRRIETTLGEELDILIADARYQFIGEISRQVVKRGTETARNLTKWLDQIILNRWLGIPIFFMVIYAMFLFTINIGGAFVDFFDQFLGAFLVDGLGYVLYNIGTPQWFNVLITDGIGSGIQTVATFIPIIGFLFLFLSFLEDSGYMARAAFVMDRLMRTIGLPGKTFIPLIVGFGCNVPAIMATRTLENHRDRMVAMAMSPFMSCGARLPVYALFAAAFFPTNGQNMVFLLYLIGIMVAIVTALILQRTLLPGSGAPFVMELPAYHIPTLNSMLMHAWERLKSFIFKAGRIIIPMVLILNLLSSLGTDGSFGPHNSRNSILAAVGRLMVPVFMPMGLKSDNWPAAVGIVSGILAKEAVVGSLDTLYSQQNNVKEHQLKSATVKFKDFDLSAAIIGAIITIPNNLHKLGMSIVNVLNFYPQDIEHGRTNLNSQDVNAGTFGFMAKAFDGTIGAFAYLLLILLYFPCVAVLGAIYREAGWNWAAFVSIWSTGLGYGTATMYYQLATFGNHPSQSLIWVIIIISGFVLGLYVMRWMGIRTAVAVK